MIQLASAHLYQKPVLIVVPLYVQNSLLSTPTQLPKWTDYPWKLPALACILVDLGYEESSECHANRQSFRLRLETPFELLGGLLRNGFTLAIGL